MMKGHRESEIDVVKDAIMSMISMTFGIHGQDIRSAHEKEVPKNSISVWGCILDFPAL